MNDTTEPTYRCRAGAGGRRCDFRGTRVQLDEHATAVGHQRCIVCLRTLDEYEQQTCNRCAQAARDDLDAIWQGTTDLERRIGEGAYSGGWLNPLAMVGDGSISGGGEDDHLRYRDPIAIVALLESWDRDWRETFRHEPPPYLPLGHPDRRPGHVLADCVSYLRMWHTMAAREHPAFDGYAADLSMLRAVVEHVAALALDPICAPIPCGCGAICRPKRHAGLERHFAPQGGLSDDWQCRSCGKRLKPDEYVWRLRLLTEQPGWVSVEFAARAVGRPQRTVWTWLRAGAVPSACQWVTRRIVVELAAVKDRSEQAGRVGRRSA